MEDMKEQAEKLAQELTEQQVDPSPIETDVVEIKPVETTPTKVDSVTAPTGFTNAVDQVKLNILQDSSANDEKFVKTVKDNVKDATVKLTEVEKEKAELEKQNILYHQELKDKDRQINEFEKQANKWKNKEECRQYHFNGVAPIMNFVGIKTPMNLVLLYFLTILLVPFFLLNKLFQGTIGALIAGTEDSNRPKAVKGFLWTMLAVIVALVVAICVLAILKHFAIIK